VNGTRELVISRTPYVVIYRIANQEARIVHVLHTAQRWPATH
jgi:toxin ParE1/3/4